MLYVWSKSSYTCANTQTEAGRPTQDILHTSLIIQELRPVRMLVCTVSLYPLLSLSISLSITPPWLYGVILGPDNRQSDRPSRTLLSLGVPWIGPHPSDPRGWLSVCLPVCRLSGWMELICARSLSTRTEVWLDCCFCSSFFSSFLSIFLFSFLSPLFPWDDTSTLAAHQVWLELSRE